MSIIETLTEGVVNRNLQQEGAALLNKWTQTGLLEGLNESQKQNMAVLLENQAKSLLKESNTMAGGNIEGFAAVAFPIVRRVFAGLIANDLVSVQPMSLPSGLIFFLDFTFGANIGDGASAANRFGNAVDASIYGTNRVGSQITGGVNLVDSNKNDLSGPGRGGMVGYAFGSPTGSSTLTTSAKVLRTFALTSSMTHQQLKDIRFDADVLNLQTTLGTTATHAAAVIQIPLSDVSPSDGGSVADLDNFSAYRVNVADATFATSTGDAVTSADSTLVRRLTHLDPDDSTKLLMVFVGNTGSTDEIRVGSAGGGVADDTALADGNSTIEVPIKDTYERGGALGSIQGGAEFGLEAEVKIPEIDIKVDSIAITAQTKKLKAKWTPELGQDLNAYHNIDAEVELTSILSEQIALEIDREILADLVNGATAATYYWSRSPGLFLNRETGAEVGAGAAAPDFTGTVSEWYETLVETINDVSAQIHRKTLRGGATHIVCSPEVANILEFTAGFRANVTADADKGDIGAVKVGSLNRKFDVVVDPYFPRNVILVARIGSSFLESGYVYAPYVPLQTTPTIFGPEDFVPRKGVMTRYAKKMVRPDMYGLVICRGLLGESGAS